MRKLWKSAYDFKTCVYKALLRYIYIKVGKLIIINNRQWDKYNKVSKRGGGEHLINLITRTTESRAARATMSAQETILPHSLWISSRRSSMISNALALKVRFGGASCSLGPLADPSSNTEASHPCIANYNNKHLIYIYISSILKL